MTTVHPYATRTDMFFESYYDFDITASAESDNGVSVSLGFDMGAGSKIDYNDDDVLEAQGAYNGSTLTVDQAGIDQLDVDDTEALKTVTARRRCSFIQRLDIDCRPSWHRQLV